MNFVIETLRAVVVVGVPICLFTVALVWWGVRKGYFPETDDDQSIESQIKAMGKKSGLKTIIHKACCKKSGQNLAVDFMELPLFSPTLLSK